MLFILLILWFFWQVFLISYSIWWCIILSSTLYFVTFVFELILLFKYCLHLFGFGFIFVFKFVFKNWIRNIDCILYSSYNYIMLNCKYILFFGLLHQDLKLLLQFQNYNWKKNIHLIMDFDNSKINAMWIFLSQFEKIYCILFD